MTWLVTGVRGMLGTELAGLLAARDIEYDGVDLGDLDLLDASAVSRAVAGHEVVVNCAAWTDVNGAESHEAEAFAVNATAVALLGRAARKHGATVVHISTDYVFAGDARSPYDEDATLRPRSAYGRTKAAGEWALRAEAPDSHLILRTAWLYGAHGRCFPRTIAAVAADQGAVSVVDDQFGAPTWTRDLAELVLRLVEAGAPVGTWHATASGQTSWYSFAQEVVAAAGLSPDVVTPRTSEPDLGAVRPAYSVLGHDRLATAGITPIGDWRERWRVAASEVLALDQQA